MFFTYVLRCKRNVYFLGLTERRDFSLKYFHPGSNIWTTLHPPLEVHNLFQIDSPEELDEVVLDYMQEHGVSNVRGGSYSDLLLSGGQLEEVEKRLRSKETKDSYSDSSSSAWDSDSEFEGKA